MASNKNKAFMIKHNKAMEVSEFIDMERDSSKKKKLFLSAYKAERQAALSFVGVPSDNISQAVLFRSAGWLAYNGGDMLGAMEMAEKGLALNPHPEIRAELQEIVNEVNNLR